MLVEVTDRELVLPVYATLLLVPAVTLLYPLALLHVVQECRKDKLCSELRQFSGEANPLEPNSLAGSRYSSRNACPDCPLPAILNHFPEELFSPVADELYLFPRGPAGFFQPRSVRDGQLVTSALLAPHEVCAGVSPFLVALVASNTSDWAARLDIRRTWASVAKTGYWAGQSRLGARIGVVFMLVCDSHCSADRESREWQALQEEAEVFSDILLLDLPDVLDNRNKLGLATVSGLDWARRHCSWTKFFLKLDHDTFPNIPALLDILVYHQPRLSRSIIGHIHMPIRRGQRSMHDINMGQLLVYAAGPAYVLSRAAVARLATLYPFYPAMGGTEQVFITGVLARGAGLQHFSPALNVSFAQSYTTMSDWCRVQPVELFAVTQVNDTDRRVGLWVNAISQGAFCSNASGDHMTASPASCWGATKTPLGIHLVRHQ
ncbi:hypothetical protein EGW08_003472 [Elysia chlorotica]|uniref:Hexosyltransferase n=1 Tax=Elysia chlorotica TaxID=188477 RepID=A0A3S1ACZ7_ELYCH|nr:hypothetical protein EGW08_003472 [Elysia chlorotica]